MRVVYILQHSVTGTMYIGQTANLVQRLVSHNDNKNKSTRRKSGTWVLVYAEAYRSTTDALIREARLKQHGSAKRELKKRICHCFIETKSEAGSEPAEVKHLSKQRKIERMLFPQ